MSSIGWWIALAIMILGIMNAIWSWGNPWAIGLAVFGAVFVFKPAFGHDHNNPSLNDWLKSLTSKNRTLCCDGNDTDQIEDWETKGDHYRVKFRDQWFDVPDEVIVDGPNRGGGALLWMNKGYSGMSVRCFMPGTLS